MTAPAPLAPALPDDPPSPGLTARAAAPPTHAAQASRLLERLRWLTILAPVAFVEAIHITVVLAVEPTFGRFVGHVLEAILVAAGAFFFSTLVFRWLAQMQGRIVLKNRELSALNAVSRAVSGSLDQREVLTGALENVLRTMDADAGEIAVLGAGGQRLQSGAGAAVFAALEEVLAGQDRPGTSVLEELGDAGRPALEAGFRAAVWAPLVVRQRSLGTVVLLGRQAKYLLTAEARRLLEQMASHVALAVEMSRLFVDVERRSSEAEALYRVGLQISSLQELPEILRSVVDEARALLGADMAILCLQEEMRLVVAARSGSLRDDVGRHEDGSCPVRDGAGFGSHLAASLRMGETAVGELCVLSVAAQAFEPRQQTVLAGLADMAAIAIDNARLVGRERYLAVLEERDRLAREMHDTLAQVLGYLQFKTRIARNALAEGKPEKALGELDEMERLAGESYDDVREAILGLRELHPDRDLQASVGEYLEKFSRQSGVRASLEADGSSQLGPLPPEAHVQLVRVVQEALTNVRKHAGAEHVWVRFSAEDGALRVVIEDDGCGFDPAVVARRAGQRFGVWTMRERVELLGGDFSIDSAPGRGARVLVRLPVKGGSE